MDPISVEVVIARPREEVFEYLADIANHAEFTDHYLVDWRLTREDSYGVGAGARYKVRARGKRYTWTDSTITELAAPRLIVERGRTGKFNRNLTRGVYELDEGSGGTTRVTFTLETKPKLLSDRLQEIGSRGWLKRKNKKALKPPALDPRRGPGPGRAPLRRGRPAQARLGLPVPIRRQSLESAPAMQLRRLAAITAVALAAATSLAACGSGGEEPTAGETEGIYVNTGDLKYQVQISRQLNAADFEDRDYLTGLPVADQEAGRPARSGSRSSSGSSTRPRSRIRPRRSSRSTTRPGRSSSRSRSTRTSTAWPTGRLRSAPATRSPCRARWPARTSRRAA